MVETYRIKITQDAIAVLLTSDGTEVRFKDEPIEALKDILGLVGFAPNSMVSQRLLECKDQSFDLPNSYTAQVVHKCQYEETDGNCPDCFKHNLCAKVAVLIPLKQEPKRKATELNSFGDDVLDHFDTLTREPGNEEKKKDYIKFNLNERILIQITDIGWKHLEKKVGTDYIKHCIKSYEKEIDGVKWYALQAHNVMDLLGDAITDSMSVPLMPEIMIENKPLK